MPYGSVWQVSCCLTPTLPRVCAACQVVCNPQHDKSKVALISGEQGGGVLAGTDSRHLTSSATETGVAMLFKNKLLGLAAADN